MHYDFSEQPTSEPEAVEEIIERQADPKYKLTLHKGLIKIVNLDTGEVRGLPMGKIGPISSYIPDPEFIFDDELNKDVKIVQLPRLYFHFNGYGGMTFENCELVGCTVDDVMKAVGKVNAPEESSHVRAGAFGPL